MEKWCSPAASTINTSLPSVCIALHLRNVLFHSPKNSVSGHGTFLHIVILTGTKAVQKEFASAFAETVKEDHRYITKAAYVVLGKL